MIMIFSSESLATSFDSLSANISEDYLKWLEADDRDSRVMPRMYEVMENNSKDIRSEKIKDCLFGVQDKVLGANSVENVSRYFLGDHIALQVKNQKNTTECWAFSILSSLETNMAKTRNIFDVNFSERHMDYATSRTFLNNEINEKGFSREIAAGGTPDIALAYLTSGLGPVNEEVMPFIDSEEKIALSELTFQKPETKINSYVSFKSILKEQKNGKTYCYDKSGKALTDEEVTSIRNKIKSHIMNYGAIAGFTAGAKYEFYSDPSNFFTSEAYYCDTLDVKYDHAITIVGWDDNYSKENFNSNHRPTKNGAYIVLNSYGKEAFNDGYIYISYEDAYIEYYLYGITSTEKVDYSNIYQYDPYGCNASVGSTSYSSGYGANVFTRENKNVEEYLNEVSFNLVGRSSVEVYVNPNGDDLNNLMKVSELRKDLTPGYHTVKLAPVKLTGEKFAVVIKYVNAGDGFFFGVECKMPGGVYQNASASKNQSFISFDGIAWEDITNLSIRGINMPTANICIKAFTETEETEEPEISVDTPEVPQEPEDQPEELPEINPETPEKPGDEDKDEDIVIDSTTKDEEEKNESSVIITVTKEETNDKTEEKPEILPEEPKEEGEEKPEILPEEPKEEEEEKPEILPEEPKEEEEEKPEILPEKPEVLPEEDTKEDNSATVIIEVNNEKVEEDNDTSEKEENKNIANVIITVGNSKNFFSNWYKAIKSSIENAYKSLNVLEIYKILL